MKKLALFALVTLVVVFSSVGLAYAQIYGPVFRIEYNTDRQGKDIRAGYSASLDGCMNNCANSLECRAFTWVDVNQQPPNYNNPTPLCWLKSSAPGRRRNPGMITGVKQ